MPSLTKLVGASSSLALVLSVCVIQPHGARAFQSVVPHQTTGARTAPVPTALQAARREGEAARSTVLQGFVAAAAGATLASAIMGRTPRADAEVFFDGDRYGDKELKIATVNKLKQKLRNAVAEDTSLAVPFLRIAINDGVGFSLDTNDGGPDGSILFELDEPQNAGLKPAVARLIKIKQEVQSTNEITLADIIAVAGGTVIEAVGGPRISVQLGRYDAKSANKNPAADGYGWEGLTGAGIKNTFVKAGLSVREAALLYGAVGAIQLATAGAKKAAVAEDEEDDFDEEQPYIPTTFGRAQDIFGAQIGSGNFDGTYLATVIKGGKTGLPQLDKAILEDPAIKQFAQKYGSNSNAFKTDVVEAYQRLTTLGFTGTTRNS